LGKDGGGRVDIYWSLFGESAAEMNVFYHIANTAFSHSIIEMNSIFFTT
jgi:hypothetical protein